jgi:hypothetical protein
MFILGKIMRARSMSTFILCVLLTVSCATRQSSTAFRVLPTTPNYLLRSPDSLETPFPEILRAFNGFEPARSWIDLRPGMELQIENAYYQSGVPKRGLTGFLGTEIALYVVRSQGGLRLVSVKSIKDRPNDQTPAEQLIRASQRRYRYYRYYFAIVFKRNGNKRGSLLLEAESKAELDTLASRLSADPDSVCEGRSAHCTVFPESCSVTVEMEIVVNGTPQSVIWGSLLGGVAPRARQIELSRLHKGRLTSVELDVQDSNSLRLPLLPGDHINWN